MSDQCSTNQADPMARRCECQYRPNVDILEKEEEIVILADLPGATPESIEVDYDDGELSITAQVEPRQDAETEFLAREYGTGDYSRKFRISEVVDAEQITAGYTDGVLAVHLPKVPAAKPRKIVVQAN